MDGRKRYATSSFLRGVCSQFVADGLQNSLHSSFGAFDSEFFVQNFCEIGIADVFKRILAVNVRILKDRDGSCFPLDVIGIG